MVHHGGGDFLCRLCFERFEGLVVCGSVGVMGGEGTGQPVLKKWSSLSLVSSRDYLWELPWPSGGGSAVFLVEYPLPPLAVGMVALLGGGVYAPFQDCSAGGGGDLPF